jgi:two-component system, LytTR family, response regulator
MQIYKTIIIEDNADNRAVLKKIIAENHSDLEIIAEATSVETAVEVLATHAPDIVLMDIELTPGTSFDVLTQINQTQGINFEIIFITAHQRYDYATKAIDHSCLAFLSKPIDPEILRGAIEKAKEKQTEKIQFDQLLKRLQAQGSKETQIIVPTTNNEKVAIFIQDINYLEADEHLTRIYFQDGSKLTAFRILGHFKKMLMEDNAFFLVHNSLLVHVEQVKSYTHSKLLITLKNGVTIKASKRFGKDFKQYWDDHSEQKGGLWQDFKSFFKY